MFSGALELLGLRQCDAKLKSEMFRMILPHWQVAVVAPTGLALKGAGFEANVLGHKQSRVCEVESPVPLFGKSGKPAEMLRQATKRVPVRKLP